jgi:hypothetical protein
LVVTPIADVFAPFAGIPTYTPAIGILESASIIFPDMEVKVWENEKEKLISNMIKMNINFFTIVGK